MELGWGPSITLKMVRFNFFPIVLLFPASPSPTRTRAGATRVTQTRSSCGYRQHHTSGLGRTPPCRSTATMLVASDARYLPLARCPVVALSLTAVLP
jgi:hypothetical protein